MVITADFTKNNITTIWLLNYLLPFFLSSSKPAFARFLSFRKGTKILVSQSWKDNPWLRVTKQDWKLVKSCVSQNVTSAAKWFCQPSASWVCQPIFKNCVNWVSLLFLNIKLNRTLKDCRWTFPISLPPKPKKSCTSGTHKILNAEVDNQKMHHTNTG